MLTSGFNVSCNQSHLKISSYRSWLSPSLDSGVNTWIGGCDFFKMGKMNDLTNKRYGKLVAISTYKQGKDKSYYWNCICDCGNNVVVKGSSLTRGHTKSCGCYHHLKHGMSIRNGTKIINTIYSIWMNMKARCYNHKEIGYLNYGARGIIVCDRWLGKKGFQNFYKDMGERPDGKTLDRFPDINGNYEPSNCRWATPMEQNQAKRNNVWLEAFGERKVQEEWARELGVNSIVISVRIKKGIPIENIIGDIYSGKIKSKRKAYSHTAKMEHDSTI